MSIDNSELLMLLGGKKSKSTIGIAGQQGFGVGVYGGSPADLKAMGLTPMEGCDNPNSDNYGNYIHTNGSVMVFIPAFAIRIGNASAPLYSKYEADTIEIGDVELNGKDGWAIPRGFYDGGKLHQGFFIDKYLCSKDSTGMLAVSVKNGDQISLSKSYISSKDLPNCVGQILDAIELSRVRGDHYSLVSCYQWAVISLITQAHAQTAVGTEACAWYDASGQKNYPKGNNKRGRDVDDKTITFNSGTYTMRTGSANPFAKTTHNGQVSGICDVNGNMFQPVLGWQNTATGRFKMAKLSVKMHDFTKDNRNDDSLFDDCSIFWPETTGWGYWGFPALYAPDDPKFSLCGVLPKTLTTIERGTEDFGKDGVNFQPRYDCVLLVAGYFNYGDKAGSWFRYGGYLWSYVDSGVSFRAAAYPP